MRRSKSNLNYLSSVSKIIELDKDDPIIINQNIDFMLYTIQMKDIENNTAPSIEGKSINHKSANSII